MSLIRIRIEARFSVAICARGALPLFLSSTSPFREAFFTSNTGKNLRSVAYGSGTYVAVGDDGTIVSSGDWASWTNRTSGTEPKALNEVLNNEPSLNKILTKQETKLLILIADGLLNKEIAERLQFTRTF